VAIYPSLIEVKHVKWQNILDSSCLLDSLYITLMKDLLFNIVAHTSNAKDFN